VWIVKEDLVGTQVRAMHRDKDAIVWRGIVRAIGIQGSFRLLVEITWASQDQAVYGSLPLGVLLEVAVEDEWVMIAPDRAVP
jgi:hypothetical protein